MKTRVSSDIETLGRKCNSFFDSQHENFDSMVVEAVTKAKTPPGGDVNFAIPIQDSNVVAIQ